MDQSMWQTTVSFDLQHSSHKWIQTIFSCGKHCKTMQTGTVSRLRFCRRSWGLKIYIRWNIVYFRKPHVRSNQLDVWETNFSFAQLDRIRNHFFGCRFTDGRYTRAWICGIWSLLFFTWKRIRAKSCWETCLHLQRGRQFLEIDDLNNVDFVPSNANSFRQEAMLYIFEDNEAVIKVIIKEREVLQWDNVCRIHRVALDWLFDRTNSDSKIQIKYIDTKNHLADILTKGNFTRDEWNHLLCLFNNSHFSSINSVKAMSKRTQEGAGEERVTAKSRPMTNLVSRCRVRDPTVLASTASENPGNTESESQKVLLSSLNVQLTGTEKPVTLASSSNSSQWNKYDKWSSQVRKSGEMSKTSTVKPVSNKLVIDIDMDSDTATESDFSLKSRWFLNRVSDRLRKMLNRSPEDLMQDIDKRSLI